MAVDDKKKLEANKKVEKKEVKKIVKKAEETGKPIAKAKEEPVFYCVYIGPNLRGVIQAGTIYPGDRKEVEARLSKEIERFPLIKRLIVTDKTFVNDRVKVKEAGNILNRYYKELAGNKEDK